ncbi:SOS response UmuD protein [[Leptolyngbya] sp. PCC 7376]|uniref:LexA family protein n=1 Tax=[Leptolyngbya] sp. PCC 7376 TaxID=111781 RepID=UPI00029EDADC|nr:S24 family peptidase [[Leptolyngbya] sp. PCC 7376]AFY38942.1 SOS response UmuD protein [[Leptolyngbya] sp. PCC 7376]
MSRGGFREKSGRKPKWGPGEKTCRVPVPQSIRYALEDAIEELWHGEGLRGQALIDALLSIRFRKLPKYNAAVSAGGNRTSSAGGEVRGSDYEEVDLFEELITKPENMMILPVVGDSMIGIGIYQDDWLIVEKIDPLFERPKEGDIVIASINDEDVVKRYLRENGQIVLASENPDYPPIKYSEGSIYISGIVKSVIRRNL